MNFRRINHLLRQPYPLLALRELTDGRVMHVSRAQKVIEMAEDGNTVDAIVEELGVGISSVRSILLESGVRTQAAENQVDKATSSEPVLDLAFVYLDEFVSLMGFARRNLDRLKIDVDRIVEKMGENMRELPSVVSRDRLLLTKFELTLNQTCALYASHGVRPPHDQRHESLLRCSESCKFETLTMLCHSRGYLEPNGNMQAEALGLGHHEIIKGILDVFPNPGNLLSNGVFEMPYLTIAFLASPEFTRLGPGFLPMQEQALMDLIEANKAIEVQAANRKRIDPYLRIYSKIERKEKLWHRRRAGHKLRSKGIAFGIHPDNWKNFQVGSEFSVNRAGSGYRYHHATGFTAEEEAENSKLRMVSLPWAVDWGGLFDWYDPHYENPNLTGGSAAPSGGDDARRELPPKKNDPYLLKTIPFKERGGKNAVAIEFDLPELQGLVFRVISGRRFADKVRELKKHNKKAPFYGDFSKLGSLWYGSSRRYEESLKKIGRTARDQALVVGVALVTFDVDFILSAAQEKERQAILSITGKIHNAIANHLLANKASICGRLTAWFGGRRRVAPEDFFSTALGRFRRDDYMVIRANLLCARRAFTARIKNAAVGGVALKSLAEAKRLLGSSRFRFDQYWPVVGIDAEGLNKAFTCFIERVTKGETSGNEVSLDDPNSSFSRSGSKKSPSDAIAPTADGFEVVDQKSAIPGEDRPVQFFEIVLKYQNYFKKRDEVVKTIDKVEGSLLAELKKLLNETLIASGPKGWDDMISQKRITERTKKAIAKLLGRKYP